MSECDGSQSLRMSRFQRMSKMFSDHSIGDDDRDDGDRDQAVFDMNCLASEARRWELQSGVLDSRRGQRRSPLGTSIAGYVADDESVRPTTRRARNGNNNHRSPQ